MVDGYMYIMYVVLQGHHRKATGEHVRQLLPAASGLLANAVLQDLLSALHCG
jgi:hypothetical protein